MFQASKASTTFCPSNNHCLILNTPLSATFHYYATVYAAPQCFLKYFSGSERSPKLLTILCVTAIVIVSTSFHHISLLPVAKRWLDSFQPLHYLSKGGVLVLAAAIYFLLLRNNA